MCAPVNLELGNAFEIGRRLWRSSMGARHVERSEVFSLELRVRSVLLERRFVFCGHPLA